MSDDTTLAVVDGKAFWRGRPLQSTDYDEIVSLLRTHLGLRPDRLRVKSTTAVSLSDLCVTWQQIRELALPVRPTRADKSSLEEERLAVERRYIGDTLNVLGRELDMHISAGLSANGVLPWIFLPPGESPWEELHRYFLKQPINDQQDYQPERVEFIRSLNPDKVFRDGSGDERYFLAVFEAAGKAVCECPFYGNATYVLRGDWMTLSKKTKAELLREHSKDCSRVVHRSSWRSKLRARLSLR